MEHNHHEDPKPSNKWVATPIIWAGIFITLLVAFLSFSTGKCCGGDCKEKCEQKDEHHAGGGHEEQHDENIAKDDSSSFEIKDTTATQTDSSKTNEHGDGGGHGETHGH